MKVRSSHQLTQIIRLNLRMTVVDSRRSFQGGLGRPLRNPGARIRRFSPSPVFGIAQATKNIPKQPAEVTHRINEHACEPSARQLHRRLHTALQSYSLLCGIGTYPHSSPLVSAARHAASRESRHRYCTSLRREAGPPRRNLVFAIK